MNSTTDQSVRSEKKPEYANMCVMKWKGRVNWTEKWTNRTETKQTEFRIESKTRNLKWNEIKQTNKSKNCNNLNREIEIDDFF